ncbi:MAG: flagellar hook-length control protein FliK [Eubacteriales bacterium]|nr:flagellar hook-length control protein FliK [Eubacteriales bacterium]
MAINISDFFKSTIQQPNQQSDKTGDITSATRNSLQNSDFKSSLSGNTILQNMLAGDTFTGFVKEINNNSALISMADGSFITAVLKEGANIKAGETATFMIEENINNQISIKAMQPDDQQTVLIYKALDASGIPATDSNINIVKELINLNMPINSETITAMSKYCAKFPEANINTIANLLRLEMPVTQENIMEFDAYRQFNGQLEKNLYTLENKLNTDIANYVGNGSREIFVNSFTQVIDKLYEGIESAKFELTPEITSHITETLKESLSSYIPELTMDSSVNYDDINITTKDLITKMLSDSLNNKDSEILKSDFFKDILHQVINETMKLTPKDVVQSENSINNYYKRIRKNVDEAQDIIAKSDLKTDFTKGMQDIKSNIDFMNDLNKNMTYFQIPVKFSEGEGNGELYVFTNKKALSKGTDNISAMLHLDMEHLGPMDVYVKLNNKNVSTNFMLESEEMLDFVYKHIDKLNKRLENLGYSTHFEMKVSDSQTDKFDFVTDFVQGDINKKNNGQYILDVKA